MRPEPPDQAPRAHRFKADLPAELHRGSNIYPCDARNLSRTGVLLVGAFPEPIEGAVHLTLKSAAGDLSISLPGRVVRAGAGGDPTSGIAVEFVDLTPSEREQLELLLSRIIEGGSPSTLESIRLNMPPHEIRKALDAVPVTQRLAMAIRATAPKEREVLLHDSNPQVLQSLARNPNLVLDDARALATHAQSPASVLQILATDPRWVRDDELKILIVCHPLVPPPLLESLLAKMKVPLLRRVAARPNLPTGFKDKILKRIRALLG